MSLVSQTFISYRGTCGPDPGRFGISPTRPNVMGHTAGPVRALPRISQEPFQAPCFRPRASSWHLVRGQQRGHQGRTDPRQPVVRSMVRAGAQRPVYPIFHGRDVHGRLRKDPHRGQVRGVGSLYLAARKTPPDGARRIASKYLAQNHKRSLHYLLLPTNCVEWVEERVRNSIRNPNHP